MKAEIGWVILALVLHLGITPVARADQVFRDPDLPLSLRYPDGWRPEAPQLASTRVLLYASDSLGTCNVGARPRSELAGLSADQLGEVNSMNHHEASLEATFRQMFPDLQVVRYWRGRLGQQEAGYMEFEHSLSASGQEIQVRSVVASTFSHGYWFSLVCNAPVDQYYAVYPAFEYMASTLLFLH